MFDLTTLLTDRRRTAAAASLLVGAAALAGCSGGDDESPAATGPEVVTVSPDPDASGSPTGEPGTGTERGEQDPGPVDLTPDELEDVEDSADDYYDDRSDALEEPEDTPDADDHPRVTGAALEDLFNQVAEFRHNGWRLDGEPEIVRQRVVRRTSNPDGVVVRVCVDNSDVRVLDRNGDEVANSRPSSPRTLNILTMVRDGDDWIVSDQRLAARPDC